MTILSTILGEPTQYRVELLFERDSGDAPAVLVERYYWGFGTREEYMLRPTRDGWERLKDGKWQSIYMTSTGWQVSHGHDVGDERDSSNW
jgi:hypothetical protein